MSEKKYIELAKSMKADNCVKFNIDDIVFDSRSILKCMFGCSDWGKGPTCPSRDNGLMPWEYEDIFKRYQWGVIIHSRSKKLSQDISFEVERQAFFDGYHFAFSLSDCAVCNECAGLKGLDCVNTKKARPAFHSVGIDVFSTVRKFSLPLETLKEEKENDENWYSAVFID